MTWTLALDNENMLGLPFNLIWNFKFLSLNMGNFGQSYLLCNSFIYLISSIVCVEATNYARKGLKILAKAIFYLANLFCSMYSASEVAANYICAQGT